jgi:uncharacterized protein (DUF2147 family)
MGTPVCGAAFPGGVQPDAAARNPDAAKCRRPRLGSPSLPAMKQVEANRWDGDIYNTSNGKIYTADILVKSDDILRVAGSFLGFLCGNEDWANVNASSDEGSSSRSDPSNPRKP